MKHLDFTSLLVAMGSIFITVTVLSGFDYAFIPAAYSGFDLNRDVTFFGLWGGGRFLNHAVCLAFYSKFHSN